MRENEMAVLKERERERERRVRDISRCKLQFCCEDHYKIHNAFSREEEREREREAKGGGCSNAGVSLKLSSDAYS